MAAYTTIDNPELYFNTVVFTGDVVDGDGTYHDQAVTGVGFEPDLLWHKGVTGARPHYIVDSVRGQGGSPTEMKHISSSATAEETTTNTNGHIKSLDSDGWTAVSGSDSSSRANNSCLNGEKYVGWCWKSGDSNTAVSASGTGNGCVNACTHRANTTSKFSIIKYTGRNDEISNGQHTRVTHGLGTKPDYIIIKDLDGAQDWCVVKGTDNDMNMRLNSNAAPSGSLFTGNQNGSTTTYFQVGNETMVNYNIRDFVAYAWTSVQGFSKFGTYRGNSSSDGVFVYLGFKPAFFMVKSNATEEWEIIDNKRVNSFNPIAGILKPNSNNAEETGNNICDFLSNGVKFRHSDGRHNSSSHDTYYMAFAEAPFVNSNGVPCNAR